MKGSCESGLKHPCVLADRQDRDQGDTMKQHQRRHVGPRPSHVLVQGSRPHQSDQWGHVQDRCYSPGVGASPGRIKLRRPALPPSMWQRGVLGASDLARGGTPSPEPAGGGPSLPAVSRYVRRGPAPCRNAWWGPGCVDWLTPSRQARGDLRVRSDHRCHRYTGTGEPHIEPIAQLGPRRRRLVDGASGHPDVTGRTG